MPLRIAGHSGASRPNFWTTPSNLYQDLDKALCGLFQINGIYEWSGRCSGLFDHIFEEGDSP